MFKLAYFLILVERGLQILVVKIDFGNEDFRPC